MGDRLAQNSRASTSAIGGERDIAATAYGDFLNQLSFIVNANSGQLLFSEETGITGTARVEWDGFDGSGDSLDATGLGGVDLTDGESNDGILLAVIQDDRPITVTLKVYSSTNWSQFALALPGEIESGERVDYFLPFSDFTVAGGSGAVFSSTGAVVLDIDSTTVDSVDFALKLIKATSFRDFGDLPSTYSSTVLIDDGARHAVDGLRLGRNVDAEANGNPSTGASGDDLQSAPPDDEDGVQRDMTDFWRNGNVVQLYVTVNGCTGTCYLNGWIDWDADGNFDLTEEHVFNNQDLGNGANQVFNVTIPGNTIYDEGTDVFARFRLCPSEETAGYTCDTVTGETTGGEVEDYWWDFGPTAVTLSSFSAKAANTPAVALVAVAAFGLALVGAVVLVNRRK